MFIKQEEKEGKKSPMLQSGNIYQGKPLEQSAQFLKLAPKRNKTNYAGAIPH